MTDLGMTLLSLSVLTTGIGGCVLLHHGGLATTYVRDLLHIGAGVWVLGWPWFQGRAAPLAIVGAVALVTLAVPLLSRSNHRVARLRDTFAAGDERWSGLSLYTLAYAALTFVGFTWNAYPAAAGLLALSLGDGVGGFVGRHLGRHRYRAPGAKEKSFEGSTSVALFAALGVAIAASVFGAHVSLLVMAGLGLAAAIAEALSPRGTDNVVVPVFVFCLAEVSS
jgi:dolichol kinase